MILESRDSNNLQQGRSSTYVFTMITKSLQIRASKTSMVLQHRAMCSVWHGSWHG